MATTQDAGQIGKIIKQLRVRADMTRGQLAIASAVSASHVTRIESGQRYPSARILRRIAPNLGIGELDLLAFAGYVSPEHAEIVAAPDSGKLDPYVVAYLSREPAVVQRAVVGVFSAMREVVEGMVRRGAAPDDDDRGQGGSPGR